MVFPILLTSYGSHSDNFSFQKSVPVCHGMSRMYFSRISAEQFIAVLIYMI